MFQISHPKFLKTIVLSRSLRHIKIRKRYRELRQKKTFYKSYQTKENTRKRDNQTLDAAMC
jgi:hypothetical protein